MPQPDFNAIKWIPFKANHDARGTLTVAEAHREIPFAVKRLYYMYNNVKDRGAHAHLNSASVAVALNGTVDLELSTPTQTKTFRLDTPERALYFPNMIFVRVHFSDPAAICLVLADTYFDEMISFATWAAYLQAVSHD